MLNCDKLWINQNDVCTCKKEKTFEFKNQSNPPSAALYLGLKSVVFWSWEVLINGFGHFEKVQQKQQGPGKVDTKMP